MERPAQERQTIEGPIAGYGPWWMGAAFALAWWLTRSQIHGWDAIAYAARAADHPLLSERYLSTQLWHPHHLLYLPLGRVAIAVADAASSRPLAGQAIAAGDPFAPLQVLSAAGAGVVVALVGLTLLARGVSRAAAYIVMLAVAGSSSMWRYGGEVEAMTPALACLMAGIYVAARAHTIGDWLRSGVCFACAVLVHELAAVVALAVGVITFLDAARGRVRVPTAAAFVAAVAAPTLLVYAWGAAVTGAAGAPGGVPGWLLAAAGRETVTQTPAWKSLVQTAHGAATAIVPAEPLVAARWLAPRDPVAWLGVALSGFAFAALVVLAWIAAPRVAQAWHSGDRLTRFALGSLVALVAFVGAYQPWNPDYWVFLPPLLALALAPALAACGRVAVSRLSLALPPLLLALSAYFVCAPRRDPSHAADAPLVGWVAAHLEPGDLVWSDAPGPDPDLGLELLSVPLRTGVDVRVAPDTADSEGLRNAHRITLEFARQGRKVVAISPVTARLALANILSVPGDTLGRVGRISILRVAAAERAEPRH